jgi:hypothetical protein
MVKVPLNEMISNQEGVVSESFDPLCLLYPFLSREGAFINDSKTKCSLPLQCCDPFFLLLVFSDVDVSKFVKLE